MSTKRKKTAKASMEGKTARSKSTIPPLILAAESGQVECVSALIRTGANVNETPDPRLHPYYGADALTVAARHGHIDVVRVLLANKANVTSRSAYGSAIQQAIDYGHTDVARILLKHGAKS